MPSRHQETHYRKDTSNVKHGLDTNANGAKTASEVKHSYHPSFARSKSPSMIIQEVKSLNNESNSTPEKSSPSVDAFRVANPLPAAIAAPFAHYTHAIVSGIPESLPASALRLDDAGGAVDLEAARRNHADYVAALRSLGIEVLVLEPEEDTPDCVFVEDAVVVGNGKAFITRPGAEVRRVEARRMKKFIEDSDLDLQIIDICESTARIDGGDVLFTGKEFFVGLSSRTNEAGVAALQRAFPECPVHGITVDAGLHLKTLSSVAMEDVIIIGSSEAAASAKRQIMAAAKHPISFVELPQDAAANVVVANDCMIHVHAEEHPESAAILEDRFRAMHRIPVFNRQLAKVDGSLTCCSVLMNLMHTVKTF